MAVVVIYEEEIQFQNCYLFIHKICRYVLTDAIKIEESLLQSHINVSS